MSRPPGASNIVLVLVLVLEKWGWSIGAWEYCAKSELHPAAAGLDVLKGRKIIVVGGPFGQPLHARHIGSTAPSGRDIFFLVTWG